MNFKCCGEIFVKFLNQCLSSFLALLLVSTSVCAYALDKQNVTLLNHESKVNLTDSLSVYRDATGSKQIKDIINAELVQFKPIQGSLSEGFTSDAIWIAFTVAKKSNSSRSIWWMELKQPLLFNRQFYKKNSSGEFVRERGILNQSVNRNRNEYKNQFSK
jgi:hypothetical protein